MRRDHVVCKDRQRAAVSLMMRKYLFFLWCGAVIAPAFAVERPSDLPHPRLLFPSASEAGVKKNIASDALAGALHRNILDRADAVLTARTCRFEKSDGRRLLPESRLALHHILHTAWAWRMTREQRYFDRTIKEMDAASAMPSWNPDHFLDTAEMSAAMAIGYDWLYQDLSTALREKYASQIEHKGLRALTTHRWPWWTQPTNNWSQVCGAGMSFAAIAIDEVQPGLCADVLKASRRLVDDSLRFYQPDGAYPEGPDYWHYGSNFHIMHLAAVDVIFGKQAVPAIWQRSAEFMIHLKGPSGVPFNFADGGLRGGYVTPAQSWIAAQFPDSMLPTWVRQDLSASLPQKKAADGPSDHRFHPLHLLWWPRDSDMGGSSPTFARFGGEQEIAFARTSWQPDAAWLAIKGGTGAASHGHLDAGSFVYEAAGVRWFCDLGKEDYNLPGYFGKQRWEYFRLNNRSHNTLVIGDALQAAVHPGATVTPWTKQDQSVACTINLQPMYARQCSTLLRHALFDTSSGRVDLRDEIDGAVAPVRWAVVTDASVSISGDEVELRKEGKTLKLRRMDQSGGAWQEFSLAPPTAVEHANKGFRMVGFVAPATPHLELNVRWELKL